MTDSLDFTTAEHDPTSLDFTYLAEADRLHVKRERWSHYLIQALVCKREVWNIDTRRPYKLSPRH